MKYLLLICLFFFALTQEFYSSVQGTNIVAHLKALENIARSNSNCRTQTSGGYTKSLEYIHGQLESRTKGYYSYSYQKFDIPKYEILERPQFKSSQKTFEYKKDYEMCQFSGSGNVTAPTQLIEKFGCQEADFANFRAGNIALIRRGECFFAIKVANAKKARAGGVVLINSDTVSAGEGIPFPVFFVGNVLGNTFTQPNVRLNLFARNFNGKEETKNFCADSVQGKEADTIVIGSHADGVPEGPGINDNGSGSASTLEIALQLALKEIKPKNKIRFCWWAAEEIGLLGSIHYVKSLSEQQAKKIVLNLNFDMLGSPNYVRAIYHGGASTVDPRIRTESGNIQKVFEQHFRKLGLEFDLSPFDGRSDYGPFIERLIPAGGLATGAEGIKTEDQRRRFGGVAGAAYDPCYHQKCDDFMNIHRLGIHEMAQNAANAVHFFGTLNNVREFLRKPLMNEKEKINETKLGEDKHLRK